MLDLQEATCRAGAVPEARWVVQGIQIYEAIGPDNAKVKAELDGMVVTRIERV